MNTGTPDVPSGILEQSFSRGLGMQEEELPASTVILGFILHQCLAVVILPVDGFVRPSKSLETAFKPRQQVQLDPS